MNVTKHPNTIMLIEDVASIAKLLTIVLQKAGYEAVAFANGETACEWFRENEPLLVLCDIMLPGMHGEEVLAFIRTTPHGKNIPVLAVTALANIGDRERLLQLGFNDHVGKPINLRTIITQIKESIAS